MQFLGNKPRSKPVVYIAQSEPSPISQDRWSIECFLKPATSTACSTLSDTILCSNVRAGMYKHQDEEKHIRGPPKSQPRD